MEPEFGWLTEIPGYRLLGGPGPRRVGVTVSASARREADGTLVTVHAVVVELDKATQRRLRTEALELQAALAENPNPFLVPLLDHERTTGGHPVLITSEYGVPMSTEADAGPLPLASVRSAAATCANALDLLHQNNLLHLGVSPDALLRYPGGRVLLACPVLKVLAELAAATTDGTGHEPPEVLEGRDWTARGEVYALASTVWTLLAGRSPNAGSREERLVRLRGGTPPRMTRADLPASMVDALRAGLAREPAHRPDSPPALVGRLLEDVEAGQHLDTVAPANPAVPDHPAALGTRYVREQRLGSGGSGIVWRVRREDGELFAAKVLHPHLVENVEAVTRLIHERSLLLRLRDDHLVQIHDIVADRGEWALVMDLVDGPNLFQLLERRQLGRAEGLRLLSEVASALAAVHGFGVVHRDLKPANILVSTVDGQRSAKLTDFGVAKLLGDNTFTQHGALLGTYAYLAPEASNAVAAQPASDMYALGITTYEVLAGYRPFRATDPTRLLHQHLTEAPARPADLTDEVWGFVAACLHKEPSRRPSAAVAADELAELSRIVARTMPDQPAHEVPPTGAAPPSPIRHSAAPDPVAAGDLRDAALELWGRTSTPPPPGHPTGGPPTEDATHPPLPEPVAEQPRRRRWPVVVAVAAVAVLGGAGGVAINLIDRSSSPPSSTTPPPSLARYGVPVTATLEADDSVELSWSADHNQLDGLQFYLVVRDDNPNLAQPLKGITSYRDSGAGPEHCYRVIAIGVTTKPPGDPGCERPRRVLPEQAPGEPPGEPPASGSTTTVPSR